METRRLEYFLALTSERNFSKAANRLMISQSALSQQIQRLEKDIGALLIDRTVVPFELTSAGERLLKHARRVLDGVSEIDGLSADARSGRVGRVRIGVVPSLLYSEIPPAINLFRRAHGDVSIEIRISPTSDLHDMVRLAQLEVAFTYTKPPQEDLNFEEVYRDMYTVVLPLDHPLAQAESVSLRDLRHEKILLSPRRDNAEAYDAILGACVDSGFSAQDITIERSSYTDQIGLVAAGMGISLLPERLSRLNVPGVRILPLRTPILGSRVLCAWNSDVSDSTRDRLRQYIHRAFGASRHVG